MCSSLSILWYCLSLGCYTSKNAKNIKILCIELPDFSQKVIPEASGFTQVSNYEESTKPYAKNLQYFPPCSSNFDSEKHGDLSLPLGLALGSPIFPSGCEGKLGVALESLQGLRDLT